MRQVMTLRIARCLAVLASSAAVANTLVENAATDMQAKRCEQYPVRDHPIPIFDIERRKERGEASEDVKVGDTLVDDVGEPHLALSRWC